VHGERERARKDQIKRVQDRGLVERGRGKGDRVRREKGEKIKKKSETNGRRGSNKKCVNCRKYEG
jgi:hypothetical protein